MEKKSVWQRVLHFPVTKIIFGLLAVGLAATLVQLGAKAVLRVSFLNEDLMDLLVAVLLAIAVIAVYIILFRVYEKRKIEEFAFAHLGFNAVLGLFTGFFILSIVILFMYLGNAYSVLEVYPVSFLLPALAIGVSSAVFEEIIFRGIIFRITEQKLGSVWALLISSSLFGFAHLANDGSTLYSAIAITIEAGILLGAAFIYSRNLWLPIFIHFAWNFSEGGIYGAIISGNGLKKSLVKATFDGPDLLTGGKFGPENSIQAVVLGLIVGAIFLILAYKQNKIIKPFWINRK